MDASFGFEPHEITLAESTRSARLKWVVIVDEALPAGLQVNAAACIAAATGARVTGMLGPEAADADGEAHPGLPWIGCSVLGATSEALVALRVTAAGFDDLLVVDMPGIAQTTRVYTEFLEVMAATPLSETAPLAVGLVGPRKSVDKLVKRMSLLP